METNNFEMLKALCMQSESQILIADTSFNILWNNGRMDAAGLDAIRRSKPLFKGLLSGVSDTLVKRGSAHISFSGYPLGAGGVTFMKSGEYILCFATPGMDESALEPLYLNSVDRFTDIVRTAVERLSLNTQAAERLIDSDDPELEETFEGIRRGAYRILKATYGAALIASYAAGTISAVKRPCDVCELVEKLCEGVTAVCDKHIPLFFSLPEQAVTTLLDIKLAERALLAVISNSLTYTRDGNAIEIKVSESERMIIITVKDRGQGIKPELQAYVCEPYYSREPAADSDYAPSLGLGLATASIFCELHGGSIAINSEFGEGTTVALSFERRDIPGGVVRAKIPSYVSDRYSNIYIELCEVCEMPK